MIFENFWNRRFTWLLSSLNISFGSSFEFSRRMCRNFELLSPRVVEYLLDPNIFRYSVFDLHPSIRILAELSLCEYQNATGSRNGIRVMTSISITRILDRGKFSISLIYIYIYKILHVVYTRLKKIPHLRHRVAKKVLLIDSYQLAERQNVFSPLFLSFLYFNFLHNVLLSFTAYVTYINSELRARGILSISNPSLIRILCVVVQCGSIHSLLLRYDAQ